MKACTRVGLLLLAATLHIRAEAGAGVETCAACHGDQGQGNAVLGAPRLAGQQVDYLLQQLRAFKAGQRGYDPQDSQGVQMRAVVASLDEADFNRLAHHYAQQQAAKVSASKSAGTAHGESLYQGSCAACHGLQAEGFAHLKTPSLRILDASYLDRQLTHYTDGTRGSDAHADPLGIWMRGIALQIRSAEDRRAIIDYLASLSLPAAEQARR
ncbi:MULTISPECIES: c-type cytochrome [Pseudomonas]|uniref:c-type cytochrome n=1 Tax=Pseudomonas TaxID=286 RepID=UPI0023D871C1|nr:c-type cytochrome [Pseudomonas sp. 273]